MVFCNYIGEYVHFLGINAGGDMCDIDDGDIEDKPKYFVGGG